MNLLKTISAGSVDVPARDQSYCDHCALSKPNGTLMPGPSVHLRAQLLSESQEQNAPHFPRQLVPWFLCVLLLPLQCPLCIEPELVPFGIAASWTLDRWLLKAHLLEPLLKSLLHLIKPWRLLKVDVTARMPLSCLALTFFCELPHGLLEKIVLGIHRAPSQLLRKGHCSNFRGMRQCKACLLGRGLRLQAEFSYDSWEVRNPTNWQSVYA